MAHSPISFAYFGGEPLAVPVLQKLLAAGLKPTLVVCSPDKPVGRKQVITPPPLKTFALSHGIEVFQPTSYKDSTAETKLKITDWDVFIVVAYNFILPKWLLEIPTHGTINVHPSLLPKLRGASPIRSAILRDTPEDVGVSVMLLDEKMDHGPILAQEPLVIDANRWPIPGPELDAQLADLGGELLVKTLPAWVAGKISPTEQDHEQATYCERFTKEDSELDIDPFNLPGGEAARHVWLKINAFANIGDTYFIHDGKRVKIKQAEFTDGKLDLLRVIPESKGEMDFASYEQSLL